MNRLVIFSFRDKYGIVDQYVEHLLRELSINSSHICIVCSGSLNTESLQKLNAYTNDIFMRDNIGFDEDAYRDVLKLHIGYHTLSQWDELLFVSNSFYGPLYPLKDVFQKMETSSADYWGLINHAKNTTTNISKHVQTFFLLVRKNMLHSAHFVNFWELNISIGSPMFDCEFTGFFQDAEFCGEAFFDAALQDEANEFSGQNWAILEPYYLIKEACFPVVLKDALLEVGYNISKQEILDYIKTSTDYNVDLIWENLLRTKNVQQIKNSLNLHYILPDTGKFDDTTPFEKVAVLAHIYYEDTAEERLKYITQIPCSIDVYITTSQEKTYEKLQNLSKNIKNIKQINLIENRGRDVASLLVAMRQKICDYEIICFVHDKKSHKNYEKYRGQFFLTALWENTLKNEAYIYNVLNVFANNPKIGLLAPQFISTDPNFGNIYLWCKSYKNTVSLAKKLNINQNNINSEYDPLALGSTFWCRTKAIKTLLEYPFVLDDFPKEPLPSDGTISHAIERIFPFVAQHHGYASGIIETCTFANNTNSLLNKRLEPSRLSTRLVNYFTSYTKCYIYGCGIFANRFTDILLDKDLTPTGYIVTLKQHENEIFMGKPVYQIDEIKVDKETGIILALNEKNTCEVAQVLKDNGIYDYFNLHMQ